MNPLANLNPPLWARTLLYLFAALAELLRTWADAEHWLDAPTSTLISGVIALIMLLAVGNGVAQVATKTKTRRKAADR